MWFNRIAPQANWESFRNVKDGSRRSITTSGILMAVQTDGCHGFDLHQPRATEYSEGRSEMSQHMILEGTSRIRRQKVCSANLRSGRS